MCDVITSASAPPFPTYFLMDLIKDCHEQQEDVHQNRYPIIKGRKPLKAQCGMNPKIHVICGLD
jgi:hypothetical protein